MLPAAPAPITAGGGGLGDDGDDDDVLAAQFQLLELLGKGSYGSVYKGQARGDTGQVFAIKVITLAEGVRARAPPGLCVCHPRPVRVCCRLYMLW